MPDFWVPVVDWPDVLLVSVELPVLAPGLEVLVPPDASELPPWLFAVPPVVAAPEPLPDCAPDPLWVAPWPD